MLIFNKLITCRLHAILHVISLFKGHFFILNRILAIFVIELQKYAIFLKKKKNLTKIPPNSISFSHFSFTQRVPQPGSMSEEKRVNTSGGPDS